MIRRAQYELLDRILQQEIKDSADALVETVMLAIEKDSQTSQRTHDWRDILSTVESARETASTVNSSNDSTQETIQYKPGKGPVALNKDALKNATERLVDRYSDAPR